MAGFKKITVWQLVGKLNFPNGWSHTIVNASEYTSGFAFREKCWTKGQYKNLNLFRGPLSALKQPACWDQNTFIIVMLSLLCTQAKIFLLQYTSTKYNFADGLSFFSTRLMKFDVRLLTYHFLPTYYVDWDYF